MFAKTSHTYCKHQTSCSKCIKITPEANDGRLQAPMPLCLRKPTTARPCRHSHAQQRSLKVCMPTTQRSPYQHGLPRIASVELLSVLQPRTTTLPIRNQQDGATGVLLRHCLLHPNKTRLLPCAYGVRQLCHEPSWGSEHQVCASGGKERWRVPPQSGQAGAHTPTSSLPHPVLLSCNACCYLKASHVAP